MLDRITLTLIVSCALAFTVAAQEKKPGLPPGDTFFTMKDRPFALEKSFPGIHAALGLTEAQKRDIAEARAATIDSEKVRAGRNLKGDPSATDAQHQEAAKAREEAQKQLQEKVDVILTADQKKLVAQIQDAVTQARTAAAKQLEGQFAASKGDPAKAAELRKTMDDETRFELNQRLEKILTPEQRAAIDAAALEAQEAAERAAKAKGVK